MIERNRAGHFIKGVSGNPKGKPKGARTKAAMMAEMMMRCEAKAITQAVIDAALEGDMAAARILVERICPVRKGAPVRIEGLPKLETLADINKAMSTITGLMAAGEISPEEAMASSAVVEMQRRAIETIELERRITALEDKPS